MRDLLVCGVRTQAFWEPGERKAPSVRKCSEAQYSVKGSRPGTVSVRGALAARRHVRGAPFSGGGASSSTYLEMWLQLMESLEGSCV